MIDPLVCVGCFLLLAGFALDIVSVATKEWVVFKNGFTYGLWTQCTNTGICSSLSADGKSSNLKVLMVVVTEVHFVYIVVIVVSVAVLAAIAGMVLVPTVIAAVVVIIIVIVMFGSRCNDNKI